MITIIGTDIIALIVIAILLSCVAVNVLISKNNKRMFILGSFLTALILLLEITGALIDGKDGPLIKNILVIFNTIGFAIMPWIIYVYIIKDNFLNKKKNIILLISIFLFDIFCFISAKTGWLFEISNENKYIRGDFYNVALIYNLIILAIMFFTIYKFIKKYNTRERLHFTIFFGMVVFGTLVQTFIPQLPLLWCCVALSQLLYFVFLREVNLLYDVVTNVGNRNLLDSRIIDWEKKDGTAIVVFDLNSLKKINDRYGHTKGDEYLNIAAKIIRESFEEIGEAYRMGGDEFCVLVKKSGQEYIEKAIEKMKTMSKNCINFGMLDEEIAYGYVIRKEGESFKECLIKSDELMYKCKKKQKEMAV